MDSGLDTLYTLLPAVYRTRDAERGHPLRDLLRVVEQQAQVLERDVASLYDNWFIETCDDWVVPYLGDLVGYRLLPESATLADGARDAVRLGRVLAPRRDVANTIASRRRKGTLALLEDLARDVSDWPARAVEFYRLLGWMQHLDHLRPGRGGTAELRDPGPLALVDGPFDAFAHSVDVRRCASRRRPGRHRIPGVGLFVFRLRSYPVTATPAYCLEERGPQSFTMSVLGNDTPLFQRPEPEDEPTHIADEANLPVPLRRHRFAERGPAARYTHVSADCYGDGKSVLVYAPDWPAKGQGVPVPADAVVPADLSTWHYRVPRGRVAIDPELGRMVFPVEQRPKRGVWVAYRYGFAGDLGGGEYPRRTPELEDAVRYFVHAEPPVLEPDPSPLPDRHFTSIGDALRAWSAAKQKAEHPGHALVIELVESGVYDGRLDVELDAGEAIQIRASERVRPVLRLLDYRASQPDSITVKGHRASRLVLDGLLIAGRGIEVQGPLYDVERQADDDLCELVVRHCTLVPGWTLHCDCEPKRPNEPSVVLDGTSAAVRVEHSILGSIAVTSRTRRHDPAVVTVCDSILDATGVDRVALGAPDEAVAYVDLRVVRSTVIGEVQAHTLRRAEDSIFTSHVRVLRRQVGCMRFCWVPYGSRTPRRFHCQPDLAITPEPGQPPLDPAARDAELLRVRPLFMAARYGRPDYGRFADACCIEIREGASDRAAMGAFHDLYEPQRAANLTARLDEYAPAGTDAAIIYAT
jgi:hypothetical protein